MKSDEHLLGRRMVLAQPTELYGGRNSVDATLNAETEVRVVSIGHTQVKVEVVHFPCGTMTFWMHSVGLRAKPLRGYPVTNAPEIVCLVGSTKFKDEFIAENRRLSLEGKIVFSLGFFGHCEPEFDWTGGAKERLNALHLHKIDMCDRVHVINVGGYIGTGGADEIGYAQAHGKTVTYLEQQ